MMQGVAHNVSKIGQTSDKNSIIPYMETGVIARLNALPSILLICILLCILPPPLQAMVLCFCCRILSCQAPVTCCCFSPQKASLAFAGGEDGSVVLWDLREPLAMHRPLTGGRGGLEGRAPTFSTGEGMRGGLVWKYYSPSLPPLLPPPSPPLSPAGIPQLGSHCAPVVSISSLSIASGGALDPTPNSSHSLDSAQGSSHSSVGGASEGEKDLAGLSFQLASLDR